jgi:hypothetical protein
MKIVFHNSASEQIARLTIRITLRRRRNPPRRITRLLRVTILTSVIPIAIGFANRNRIDDNPDCHPEEHSDCKSEIATKD